MRRNKYSTRTLTAVLATGALAASTLGCSFKASYSASAKSGGDAKASEKKESSSKGSSSGKASASASAKGGASTKASASTKGSAKASGSASAKGSASGKAIFVSAPRTTGLSCAEEPREFEATHLVVNRSGTSKVKHKKREKPTKETSTSRAGTPSKVTSTSRAGTPSSTTPTSHPSDKKGSTTKPDEKKKASSTTPDGTGGSTTTTVNKNTPKEPPVEEVVVIDPPEAPPENVFGYDEPVRGCFEGVVYPIPAQSKKLPTSYDDLEGISVIYACEWDIPTRAWEQGFPGVEDHFEWFAIRYSGSFNVATAGKWNFRVSSDDGVKLYIDGKLVLDNDGVHPPRVKSGSVDLSKGDHEMVLEYFQGPRYHINLQLYATPPGGEEGLFSVR